MSPIKYLLIKAFFSILAFSSFPAYAKTDVSLQLIWKHQFQFAGYYIAKEKGFYKNAGLNVSIIEYSQDFDIPEAVAKGNIDFAVGRSSILVSKGNGLPIKALFAAFQDSPLMLITRGDISNPRQLKGKKIMMTSDAISGVAIQAMLLKSGVASDDYTHQNHTFNLNDLIDNQTDAMGAYISNEPYQMKKRGLEYSILHPAKYGFDMYSDILYTSNTLTQTQPHIVRNFFEASIKGWEYAFNNIDETAQIIKEKYNTQNRSLEALIYEGKALKDLAYKNKLPFGKLEKEQFGRMANIYLINDLMNADYQIDDFIYHGNEDLGKHSNLFNHIWQLLLVGLLCLICYLIYRNQKIESRNVELVTIAEQDPLTGLYNRHKLLQKLHEYINLSKRYNRELSCLFIDIDNFKSINDLHGHNHGDQVLITVADLFKSSVRETDLVARWGGEEFVIIMPETDKKFAEQVALNLCDRVRSLHLEPHTPFTCSIGVSGLSPDETVEEFIGRADKALYMAKREGKNRVIIL